jgi:hypothetical protein
MISRIEVWQPGQAISPRLFATSDTNAPDSPLLSPKFATELMVSFERNLTGSGRQSCPFQKFHPAWDSHREVESSHDCGPVLAILQSLGMCILDLFKSRRRLEAENLFLRHQLSIALRRCAAASSATRQ